jgi:hypothetical protein
MRYICLGCSGPITVVQRRAGHCPQCGQVFETAELVALCIGLTCSYLLALVLPELLPWLFLTHAWHNPSDTAVLLRATAEAVVLVPLLPWLSRRYTLWQGIALQQQPALRLLWLLGFPGLLFASVVLTGGVGYLSLLHRWAPGRAFSAFLGAP